MCHPDDESFESRSAERSADKMRADFANWEPRCVFLFAGILTIRINAVSQDTEAITLGSNYAELDIDGSSSSQDVGTQGRQGSAARGRLPSHARSCRSSLI